jgi:C1A family cysteine protease
LVNNGSQSLLPAKYDLRESNIITLPKKQAWGTCWAHSAISSIESNFLSKQKDKSLAEINFSEYHMDKFNGFNRDGIKGEVLNTEKSGQGIDFIGSNLDDRQSGLLVHQGGDMRIATAYIANNGGVVNEKKSHFISNSHQDHDVFGNTSITGIKRRDMYRYYFSRDIQFLTLFGTNREKRIKIKKAIINHGAVSSGQVQTNKPFGFFNNMEVHFHNGNKEIDHAISLIGWNDHLEVDGHVGAWLVKDSFHQSETTGKYIKYFYILYDDIHVAKNPFHGGTSFANTQLEKFNSIYTHSLHGWRYTSTNLKIKAVASKYLISREKKIAGVGIYSTQENSRYVLTIHSSSLDGPIVFTKVSKVKYPGFHFVSANSLSIKSGIYFIKLALKRPAYPYDASSTVDVLLSETTKKIQVNSSANKGESYYLIDGQWKDFSSYKDKHNLQRKNSHAMKYDTANISMNLYTH